MASEFSTLTLENALEDLSSRFIVNLPQEELESEERVLFQIEQAHWYYEDFIRPAAVKQSLLPSFALKPFSLLIFRSCPLLHDLVPRHAEIWADFMAYKERVPVCGAILISESWDKVLMVKGYQKGASWSFPRGKINKDEPEADCAVREVLEETGYDIFPHFPIDSTSQELRDPYYVELVVKEQRIRLYFIPNVSETAYFETRTRKEISKIDWFAVNDLPTYKSLKKGVQPTPGVKQPKFYMIAPFITHLKLWIQANRPKKSATSNQKHRPPHLEDEYRPPLFESDIDVGRSTSSSNESPDEVEIRETKKSSPIRFETAEQGTAALQAFFFGVAAPASVPVEEWKEEVVESEEDPLTSNQYRTVTPPFNYPIRSQQHAAPPHDPSPILAFERQQPLVQPKPKASTTQTNLLLALLTSKDPVASPPPSRNARPISPPTTKSDHPLLSSLDNLFSQAPPPPPLPNYSNSLPSLAYLVAPTSITPVDLKVQEKLEKRSNLLSVLNDLTFSNPGSVVSPSSASSHGLPSPRTGGNGGLPFGHSPQYAAPSQFASPSTFPPLQQVDTRSNLMSTLNNSSQRIPDQDSQVPAAVGHTPQQRQMLSLLQQSTFNAPPVPPHPPTREESTRPTGYGPPPSQFPPPPFVVHHTVPVNRPPFSFPPNQPPQQYLPQQISPNFAHPPPPRQYQPFPPPHQHPHHQFQPQHHPNHPPPPQQFRQFQPPPNNPSFPPPLAPRFVSPPSLPPMIPSAPVPSRSVDFPPLPPPVPIHPIKTQQSASLLSIFNQRQVEA